MNMQVIYRKYLSRVQKVRFFNKKNYALWRCKKVLDSVLVSLPQQIQTFIHKLYLNNFLCPSWSW